MAKSITTFLMFEEQAEEAINFYVSLFPNSRIDAISRYGAAGPGRDGTVIQASFTLNGQSLMAIDSPAKHAFTFTPSISLFVVCENEAEIDVAFGKLSYGGQVMMPLAPYPFAKKFGWCADRFGVSWQLSLN